MTTPRKCADKIAKKVENDDNVAFIKEQYPLHRSKWKEIDKPTRADFEDALSWIFNDSLFTSVSIEVRNAHGILPTLFSENLIITIRLRVER